ncbi:MAG: DUF3224 domain-containing protein, partial [Nocardioides sp.]
VDRTGRFNLTKVWHGDLVAEGTGVMLSAGDPATGRAGYVALESVEGTLHGRAGGFCFVQLGLMAGEEPTLTYAVVPGSGHGDLAGITGELRLDVDESGAHRYSLSYDL